MRTPSNQVLTAAQMRAAEGALIAGGISVDQLMQRAGQAAAEWVWRISGGRAVTVLTGPGNNGGDGWVIAAAIRARGGDVAVIMAAEPVTAAAQVARAGYHGQVLSADSARHGEVFVDCLFGTGLTRAPVSEHVALLSRLAASHHHRIAIDLPSGIDADLGQPLGQGLPDYDLTVALGAWKPAHFLMPAAATMGTLRLVEIGIEPVDAAALVIARPRLASPAVNAHKYARGLLGVIAGAMPGAALLAASAAQGAGAGYVKLLGESVGAVPADLVAADLPLGEALLDKRLSALLIGPGLGRGSAARKALALVLSAQFPAVLDADALVLFGPHLLTGKAGPLIATPHEGELLGLERAFACDGSGSKAERAMALARATNMVVVAKGPDTVIATPDGQLAYAPRGSSWLSTAGTGDVLAGTIASRLACGEEPFAAACQGVWLHTEAARQAGPAFSAGRLAKLIPVAFASCL